MSTPHNNAEIGDIAKVVLMPGDPLRAEFIAKNYLTDVKCYNKVRNMLGFTGKYKDVEISVQGSGMGIPSIGIYSYELFNFYNVEAIIRTGTIGGMADDINLRDIVIAQGACTDSNYVNQFELNGHFAPIASYDLLSEAVLSAQKKNVNYFVGNVLSSDCFYNDNKKASENWVKMGVLGVEMEAAALYMNAARAKKKALCVATVSDHIFKGTSTTAQERETDFNNMMEIALETAVKI
jgi:purine-nucleoside phosphorylase